MDRQDKLDAVLKDLQAIPGVKYVVSDDFTDEGYWVFLTLSFKGYKPEVVAKTLTLQKSPARSCCKKNVTSVANQGVSMPTTSSTRRLF